MQEAKDFVLQYFPNAYFESVMIGSRRRGIIIASPTSGLYLDDGSNPESTWKNSAKWIVKNKIPLTVEE